MKIGTIVEGTNMDGRYIKGKIENAVSSFGVVIVRTGEDRTNITYCYVENLKEAQ